jgi:hypothetical protein
MVKHWTPLELKTLRQLRDGFLAGTAGKSNYWISETQLELYDRTFAERIGWKWAGALSELGERGWRPQSHRIVDWACGTGIASRSVLDAWPGQFQSLSLHDRSPGAMRFATERARALHPHLQIQANDEVDENTLVVLSHVINELPEPQLNRLLEQLRKAREIIWVEAGAHAESRQLITVRETLREGHPSFAAVAPCTHQAGCGLLSRANERHWCHHFAQPPSEIFQDAAWHQLSLELGIDLRSLPYSFLVLQRGAPAQAEGFSHTLGHPREFKGHDKVLSCHAGGVSELMLQKRDAPRLLRQIRKGQHSGVYRWTMAGGKIVAGEQIAEGDPDQEAEGGAK